MFAQILVVLIGCPLGIILIWKRKFIVEAIGPIGFAESWFGSGGTYTLFMLLGVLVFIGSLMWGTGALQGILFSLFGRFF